MQSSRSISAEREAAGRGERRGGGIEIGDPRTELGEEMAQREVVVGQNPSEVASWTPRRVVDGCTKAVKDRSQGSGNGTR